MRAFSIVTSAICVSFCAYAQGAWPRYTVTDLGPIGPAGQVLNIARTGLVAGAVQQNPDGETFSQAPPVAETAEAEKVKAEPAPATTRVCGSGSAPPNGLVKAS